MIFKDYIQDIGGVSKMCDIYLNGITPNKFMKRFKSNKDLIVHSFRKLKASESFLNDIKKAQTYDEIKDILIKVKGGNLKWN